MSKFLQSLASVAIFAVFVLFFKATAAAALSAQEVRLLCSGLGSTLAQDEDADFSLSDSGIRVTKTDGKLSIIESDKVIVEIDDFSYEKYTDCLIALLAAIGPVEEEPRMFALTVGCLPDQFWANDTLTELFGYGEKNSGKLINVDLIFELGECEVQEDRSGDENYIYLEVDPMQTYRLELFKRDKVGYCIASRMLGGELTAGAAEFCFPSPDQIPLKAGYLARARATSAHIKGEFIVDSYFLHGAPKLAIFVPD